MPKTKIYTKKGDDGLTSTLTKRDLKKSEAIFDILGDLDELNSILGYIHAFKNKQIKSDIILIQSQLLTIGSLIAGAKITVSISGFLEYLENRINYYDSKNTPLKNFILPAGNLNACHTFLARAICRRLERTFIRNRTKVKLNQRKEITSYINRLSDLLFVMGRYINKTSKLKDIVWKL